VAEDDPILPSFFPFLCIFPFFTLVLSAGTRRKEGVVWLVSREDRLDLDVFFGSFFFFFFPFLDLFYPF